MHLAQTIEIHPNPKTEQVMSNLAKITNGLYNTSIYENRKRYEDEKKFCFYQELFDRLKDNELYKLLPVHSAQAVLQKADGSIKSFISLYKKGLKPEFPHYHKKDVEWLVPYKYDQIKLKKNKITLPMSMEYRRQTGISYISFKIPKIRYKGEIKYLELFKIEGKWKASLIFDVQEKENQEKENQQTQKKDNLYIDMGIRNLATIFDGKKATIYSGGIVSANNQYKDKNVAKIQETLATHKLKSSESKREFARKTRVRNKQAINAMTTKIVETAKEERKGIIIGNLSTIRDVTKFSRYANQKIGQWEFGEIARQLEYKAKIEGIMFKKVSERDTSKTCSLCGRQEKGRVCRGLYRCKLYKKQFNADANGALNISKMYLRIPLSEGSGIGVVDALANPAVFHWNEHEWLCENPSIREAISAVNS